MQDHNLISTMYGLHAIAAGEDLSPERVRDVLLDLRAFRPEQILAEAKRQAALRAETKLEETDAETQNV